MIRRPHGRKPAVALWMLVAVADLAILTAAGPLVMAAIIATVAVVAGGVLATRMLARRMLARRGETATEAVVRRRA